MATEAAKGVKMSAIEIKNLHYSYGKKVIYEKLNLNIDEGKIFGVLGKNGVGKSTLINILMGFIKPKSGECLIFNEPSSNLSSSLKRDIGLLHEGFVTYDFMSIAQIEAFFAPFYPKWDKKLFYELVDLMDLRYSQKLSTLSYGQKSQIVLGLIFAQNAKLLIFDDYSMGLDAGYRKLFVQYLKEYVKKERKTVLVTSHVMGDLVDLIDEMIIVQKGGEIYQDGMSHFIKTFRCYELMPDEDVKPFSFHRIEKLKSKQLIYTFKKYEHLKEVKLDFEDKFLGFVGKYE